MEDKKQLKIKYMSEDQIRISIDRLTRFKSPQIKYPRVFEEIIVNHLISPSFKKTDLEKLNPETLKNIVEEIINLSLLKLGYKIDDDYLINQRIYNYENKIFNISDEINILIKNKIHYKSILNFLNYDIPFNLKWLKTLPENNSLPRYREKYELKYPLEKIVLAEGLTEEILLPKFAQTIGYNFNKSGVYVISAGGKNQVVKYFYQFAQDLKIPIFVLLDKDAETNYNEIKPRLRSFDKVHVLKSGEFEDLLPIKLVERTLNSQLKNISDICEDIEDKDKSMVKRLEKLFKTRGLHEFKKSEFALNVKNMILTPDDVSEELKEIISEIKELKSLNTIEK